MCDKITTNTSRQGSIDINYLLSFNCSDNPAMINLGEKNHFQPLYAPTTPDVDDDEIDLRNLWQILVRRKTTIILITLLTLAIATSISSLIQPIYESKATLHIAPAKIYTTNLSSKSLAAADYIQTQLQYVKSREMARNLANTISLFPNIKSPNKLEKSIIESTIASPVKKSQVINLGFKHYDPTLAQTTTTAIIQELKSLSTKQTNQSLDRAELYWQKKLTELSPITEQAKLAIDRSKSVEERISLTNAYLRYQGQLESAQSKLKTLEQLRQESSNFTIISHANLPETPSSPNIKLNMVLGLVLGLFIGIGIAFTRDFLDKNIKSKDELLQLSSLSIIGQLSSNKDKPYRSLRTKIMLHRSQSPRPLKSFCIAHTTHTAATICSNLAKAFANTQDKVLLIDTDIHHPVLHTTLNETNNESGLSDWLLTSPPTTQVEELIQSTQHKNVFLLAVGEQDQAIEFLNTDKFQILLSEQTKNFDTIIINTPPLNQSLDALIPAYCADATLFSVEINHTQKNHLTESLEQLQQANANVLGFVVS